MANLLYHIARQETYDREASTLFIQPGINGLFLIVSQPGKLIDLKYYQFEDVDPEAYLTELTITLDENCSGQPTWQEALIVSLWPDHCFVPDQFYASETNRDILDLTHGDLQRGTVLSERVRGYELHSVYRMPAEVYELLTQRFPDAGIWHFNSLWLECSRNEILNVPELLNIVIFPGYMVAIATKAGEPLLQQRFPYETDDDVLFYLLTIVKYLGLNQPNIFLSGTVLEEGNLFQRLRSAFPSIRLTQLAKPLGQPSNYPEHFFSSILNLSQCVL